MPSLIDLELDSSVLRPGLVGFSDIGCGESVGGVLFVGAEEKREVEGQRGGEDGFW